MDLTGATALARRVRALYHRMEESRQGGPWTSPARTRPELAGIETHLQAAVRDLPPG